MTQPNPRSLFARTLANGGGTFELHAENFERADITSGFAVGLVDGTFATSHIDDARVFNYGIARAIDQHPEADAVGTWVDGDTIHIDPVVLFPNTWRGFNDALLFAIAKGQIAFFHLDTFTEFTTNETEGAM